MACMRRICGAGGIGYLGPAQNRIATPHGFRSMLEKHQGKREVSSAAYPVASRMAAPCSRFATKLALLQRPARSRYASAFQIHAPDGDEIAPAIQPCSLQGHVTSLLCRNRLSRA